jgi:osmotically-inducible protein OsmY
VAETITARLTQSVTTTQQIKGLNVQVDDQGLATLTGQVESEAARRLAENLIRLEPGIRAVRNELTVQPTGSGT